MVWVAYKQLHHRETEIKHQPIDYLGLSLLVLGVGALQMMLDRGKELDWFAYRNHCVVCDCGGELGVFDCVGIGLGNTRLSI